MKCIACEHCQKDKMNNRGEFFCGKQSLYVELIAEACEQYKSIFEKERKNEQPSKTD